MKVLLLSTGIGPFPNDGWGACENLVLDFAWGLQQNGVDVKILHTPDLANVLISAIAEWKPDGVVCEYDDHILFLEQTLQTYPTLPMFYTSHYAWLSQPDHVMHDSYIYRFIKTCQLAIQYPQFHLALLSEPIAHFYTMGGVPRMKLFIQPNGTRIDLIQFREQPLYRDRALCLGKIEDRKNQARLQTCETIDFVGPIDTPAFNASHPHYKGTWTRSQMYEHMTEYPCLVHLSQAEAHPLVIGEALAAGCAILCNEVSAANLPRDRYWIRIVDTSTVLNNPQRLQQDIREMCEIGVRFRQTIREWAVQNLDWRLKAARFLQHLSR